MWVRRVVLTGCFLAAGAGWAQDAPPEAPPLRVGEIRIVVRDIFSAGEVAHAAGPLRLLRKTMNGLHTNTRERILHRELLFRTGEPFEPERLQETARNLRAMGFLRDVSVTAVDTTADGAVAILVDTHESWTLSTSFAYSLASGGNLRWNAKAAESNFLGYGVTVGAGVGADEDRSWWNVWYRKRRLFGRALWFGVDWSETGDGHVRRAFLSRPLYALDDARGIDAEAGDSDLERRWYLSNAGPSGSDAAAEASLYAKLPVREKQAQLQGLWRVSGRGAARIWRLGGGVEITERTWSLAPAHVLSDGRVADVSWLAAEGGPMARESGVRVFPYIWVQSVGRRWTEARFVLQYGPHEDIPADLAFELKLGPAGGAVGSTAAGGDPALRWEASARKWFVGERQHVLLELQTLGQAGGPSVRSHLVGATAAWLGQAGPARSPWLGRVFVEAAEGARLDGVNALVLGLDRGLRTLEFDGMAGDRLARVNAELGKATPWEVLGLARLGAAVFYGAGCAWWQDEDRRLADARHEAGIGIRLGPTRSANTQVTRFDLTWALDGSAGPVLTAVTRGLF